MINPPLFLLLMMRLRVKLVGHILFWIGLMTLFWQCFEFAYKCSEAEIIESPVWSGTFGPLVPHHYVIGFVGVVVAYVLLTGEDFISAYRLLRYGDCGVEVRWEYVFASIIVVCAAVNVALGKMTAHDFIYVVGLVLSFLGGAKYGEFKSRRS